MLGNDNLYNNFYEHRSRFRPECFSEWDDAVRKGKSSGYYEPEDLSGIIEAYLSDYDCKRARQAIEYALRLHANNEDLVGEILILLNEHELWNDLLALCDRYKDTADVWSNGHRLTSLLHLGMEEDAFNFFVTLKYKYAGDDEALNTIYMIMGEVLFETDLFESAIEVVREAIAITGESIDYDWLLLQSYAALLKKEKVSKIADKIQKTDPLNAESWYRMGVAFQQIDDIGKAIDCFEYAHSLEPTSTNNILNLVYAYAKNGNHGKALEKIHDLTLLYPDSCAINILASKICAQVEHWEDALQMETALKYINDAIKFAPEMDELYLYKSSFFKHLGEYRKAKSALKDGIEQTDDPDGYLARELTRLNEKYPDY
ncbi:MAG: hypothetical protein LBE71_01875 [Dysgonamonadaceae bacterium]|jgi:tetratricopeptide (TPR) repeat protein|nr:hypothetical protein [Dysgonamonadaceae bacterium]